MASPTPDGRPAQPRPRSPECRAFGTRLRAQEERRAARRHLLPGVTDLLLRRERVCDEAMRLAGAELKIARLAKQVPAAVERQGLWDSVRAWPVPEPTEGPGGLSVAAGFHAAEAEALSKWLDAAAQEMGAPPSLVGRLLARPAALHLFGLGTAAEAVRAEVMFRAL